MASWCTEQSKETHNGILANSKKGKGKRKGPSDHSLPYWLFGKTADLRSRTPGMVSHTLGLQSLALIHLLDVWPLVSHITSQSHKFLFFKMELITLSWRASVKTGDNACGDLMALNQLSFASFTHVGVYARSCLFNFLGGRGDLGIIFPRG